MFTIPTVQPSAYSRPDAETHRPLINADKD